MAQYQMEKGFSQAVVDYAHSQGWLVFRTYDSKHSPAGEPDLRMIRPPRVIFAELKVGKNKPTALQAEALEQLRQCPVETFLWYPGDWDEIEATLQHTLPPKFQSPLI